MSKLKYLIVMDPLQTESSEFWKNFGESNNVTPADIQTEVFRLPTTCFAEEDGSIANSGRWAQWHWKGCDQPGEALPDVEILSMIREEMHRLYKRRWSWYRIFRSNDLELCSTTFTKFCRISERIKRLRAC